MTHLTPAEFVDLLDGRLEPSRAAHASRCRTCGAQADALAQAAAAAAVPQPHEPTPLFWEHFGARVSNAIRQEPPPSRSGAWRAWFRPAVSVPLAVAVVALATLTAVWTRQPGVSGGAPAAPLAVSIASAGEWDPGDVIDDGDAWALVRAAAADMDWDEAQDEGLAPAPGAAARMVDDLTPDERAELANLLEEELRRMGA